MGAAEMPRVVQPVTQETELIEEAKFVRNVHKQLVDGHCFSMLEFAQGGLEQEIAASTSERIYADPSHFLLSEFS